MSTEMLSPSVIPTTMLRTSTVLSGLTTYTNVDCGLRCTAAVGMITAPCLVSSSKRALTN